MKLGIIGLGNMADAMIGGILKKEMVPREDIMGSAATQRTITRMAEKYKIKTTLDNREVARWADVLILAVKPQYLQAVIDGIKDCIEKDTLLLTIAAGKRMDWYEEAFGKEIKLVRCMPNTPAMAGEGCTAVCAGPCVTKEEEETALRLMGSFGYVCRLPENLMDAFSAVAGSSPAYVFLFIEALADAGVAAGIPRAQSCEIAARSLLGSAKLLLESGKHPGELKDMVCSPGGTTIEGLKVLEEKGMRGAVMDAIEACVNKAGRL